MGARGAVAQGGIGSRKNKGGGARTTSNGLRPLVVVLDLDETLVHCNGEIGKKCDVNLWVTLPNGQSIKV